MSNIQIYLLIAGVLAIVVGLIHSILGEILIFSRMRETGIVPTVGKPLLSERHVRILWASWHIVTLFGWGFAAILLKLSGFFDSQTAYESITSTIMVCMLVSSGLVLYATNGKHPGWIGLLIVAGLCGLA